MNNWKEIILKNRFILIALFVYFILLLVNLTLLPIFNDEAIYLDWGWSHTHMPGHLFDSLLDAKQPLMIWIFGLFERFFSDPLFAGRFASLLIGSITMIGIYKLSKKTFSKEIALYAVILYAIVPIFVFYNRQALLEAAIASVGIWSCNALIDILRNPSTKNGVILGIILGLGFLTKTTSLIFIVSATVIVLFFLFKKKKAELIKPYAISLLVIFCVNLIIFINPVFWQTFSSNSRYSYTLAEIFAFPVSSWFNHLFGFFQIGFVFITPFIFLVGIIGMVFMWKEKVKNNHIFLFYFLFSLLIEIFSTKTQIQRYLVPFLPFIVIPASYLFFKLWKGNVFKKLMVAISLPIPFILSFMIIFNPQSYILHLARVSNYSDVGYVLGQTSGYGITETMQYINEHSVPSQPTLMLFGLNIGNPESAIDVYSQKYPQIFGFHIDAQLFQNIDQYKCFTSTYPVFLVTREGQLLGLDRYFSLEKSFLNPDNKYSVRIYTLKKHCSGNSIALSDIYQQGINQEELQLKGN